MFLSLLVTGLLGETFLASLTSQLNSGSPCLHPFDQGLQDTGPFVFLFPTLPTLWSFTAYCTWDGVPKPGPDCFTDVSLLDHRYEVDFWTAV